MKTKTKTKAMWVSLIAVVAVFLNEAICSEHLHTGQFVQGRTKFDRFLETKNQQSEIDLICEQYSSSLQRLLESIPTDLGYLRQCVADEITRTAEVKNGYLNERNRFRRVQLDYFWPQNLTHKEAVADFRTVLNVVPSENPPIDRPDIRGGFGDDVKIFGLPWLDSVDSFLEKFQDEIRNQAGSKTSISMPGFPKSSFYYYAFDGEFTKFAELDVSEPEARPGSASASPIRLSDVGSFNRMHLVTDSRDQVVAVQFSCEAPRREPNFRAHNEVGVFNFVLFRRKAIRTAAFYQTDEYKEFYKITSILKNQDGRLLEVNVFYIPKPTAELIQFVLSHPN